MPQRIQHIDAIARQKRRDVLFLIFYEDASGERSPYSWDEHPGRQLVVDWLDAHGLCWNPCGEWADERVMRSYRGSIYVDVAYSAENASYRALEAFLENSDGTLRIPFMRFLIADLDAAQMNAHHDEPGFWERWAEDF